MYSEQRQDNDEEEEEQQEEPFYYLSSHPKNWRHSFSFRFNGKYILDAGHFFFKLEKLTIEPIEFKEKHFFFQERSPAVSTTLT